jgi:hypothetical protein
MIEEYLCASKDHSRYIKAAASDVAGKRFLNYLRLHTKDRPLEITVETARDKYAYRVEWYTGPKREGMGKGVVGEWYSLWGPK